MHVKSQSSNYCTQIICLSVLSKSVRLSYNSCKQSFLLTIKLSQLILLLKTLVCHLETHLKLQIRLSGQTMRIYINKSHLTTRCIKTNSHPLSWNDEKLYLIALLYLFISIYRFFLYSVFIYIFISISFQLQVACRGYFTNIIIFLTLKVLY